MVSSLFSLKLSHMLLLQSKSDQPDKKKNSGCIFFNIREGNGRFKSNQTLPLCCDPWQMLKITSVHSQTGKGQSSNVPSPATSTYFKSLYKTKVFYTLFVKYAFNIYIHIYILRCNLLQISIVLQTTKQKSCCSVCNDVTRFCWAQGFLLRLQTSAREIPRAVASRCLTGLHTNDTYYIYLCTVVTSGDIITEVIHSAFCFCFVFLDMCYFIRGVAA